MVAVSSVMAAMDRGGQVVRAGVRTAARFGGRAMAGPHAGNGYRRADTDVPVPPIPVSFVEARAAGLPALPVAYERSGTGDPLVLVHGLGLNRRTWDAVVPGLTGGREVITLDLPGFGQSPDWPAGLRRDLPTTATVLGAAFTALGLQRPHVVGHSLGGLIALALGQVGLARSVTALAPAGFWNETERRYAFAVLATARRIAKTVPDGVAERLSATAAGRAILAGMLYGDPAECPPGAITRCLNALRDADGFEATLRAGRTRGLFNGQIPRVPVTILWGTADRILPRRQARRAAAMMPQARLIWLPGCGHVPMNDAPELIADMIVRATGPEIGVPGITVPGAAKHPPTDAPTP